MIKVNHLTYDYAGKRALQDVSFEIAQGSITALVGPNGAGKTTLLRSLAALTKPLSGNVFINNINAFTQPQQVHAQVGYLGVIDISGVFLDTFSSSGHFWWCLFYMSA
ncbi:MAG: ATP-binding cassette domain-containing protein [Bacteroidia bacterium]